MTLQVERWTERIRDVVDDAVTKELVATYFATDQGFASDMFDTLGNNPRDKFTSDDLLAVSLMDVRFSPRAVRAILKYGDEFNSLLREIPYDVDIWDSIEYLDKDSAGDALWEALKKVDTVGITRVNKLLARKRPRLFPVLDSVILKRALQPRSSSTWLTLHGVLQDSGLRDRIMGLKPDTLPVGYTPSLLRLLDVALWMTYSNSQAVQAVRHKARATEVKA